MDALIDYAWQWITLLLLLAASGFISGSETALFSLTRHQLHTMRQSPSRLTRLPSELLGDPRRLLSTILIANNTVNVLLFAVSYVLVRDLTADRSALATSIGGGLSLLIVIIFGEVIPKVIASTAASGIASLVAPVVHALQVGLGPVRVVLETAFVEPLLRLIGRPIPTTPHVTADELKTLLDMSRREGVIDPGESTWLQQVVDLAEARVHEVMVPRVDIVAFDISRPVDDLVALFRETHFMKLPVYEEAIDQILGVLYARDVLPNPDPSLREIVRPVQFVPEQMRLDQLLGHFRRTRTQTAAVVDEYGGVAGLVTLEDVLEHIVGDIHDEEVTPSQPDVEALEEGVFSVAGRLSVRALAQALGPEVLDDRVDTIAGLVVARIGRLPAVGEQVRLANIVMTVETMTGRRIDRVRIRLENDAEKGRED